MRLSTNLLVQFNSSSMHTIHRFIPEGIRSYPGTVSLIELLVQIVDQVRQRWIHASESGGIGALFGDDHGLLALTQAVSTSMVSFIKVYVDPMCPANDPLCPSLAQALLSGRGMSCIINILISYIRAILSVGPSSNWIQVNSVAKVVENSVVDFAEGRVAISLLETIVRRSARKLANCQAWGDMVIDIANGTSISLLAQNNTQEHGSRVFMEYLSPYHVGKVVEFFCRGTLIAHDQSSGAGVRLFSRVVESITKSVNQVASINPSLEVEPTVLRVIESVRGCMRCAMQRGCGWDRSRKEQAQRLGWTFCAPLFSKLNDVAANFTANVPGSTLVLSCTVRLWAHMLKVYGDRLDDATWKGLFNELDKLLLIFQNGVNFQQEKQHVHPVSSMSMSSSMKHMNSASAVDDGTANIICQFANLLIQLLLTQKTVLVKALSKGNGGKSEVELNSVGSHIVNVCFASVERLFAIVTQNLLYYPKLCERFIGLSCILVELFSERLLRAAYYYAFNALCAKLDRSVLYILE
eukprot:g845.t1